VCVAGTRGQKAAESTAPVLDWIHALLFWQGESLQPLMGMRDVDAI
jgi:hypothetical protein